MKSIINDIEKNLTPRRLEHTYGVCEKAVALAKEYGVDNEKAYIAALFHDMFKDISQEKLEEMVDLYGLDQRYKSNLNLAHSKLAAAVMKKDYGINDSELLDSVSYHTTGRAGMTLLEKIIYIADAVEPGRNYPGVENIRKLLEKEDLDEACYVSLKGTIRDLKSRNLFIDDDSIKAKDYFEKRRGI